MKRLLFGLLLFLLAVPIQAQEFYRASCRRHGQTIHFTWTKVRRGELAMRFEPGVRMRVVLAVAKVLPELDRVHQKVVTREAIVTSANDRTHTRDSLHGCGRALDLRTRDLPRDRIGILADSLRAALARYGLWRLRVEQNHIHIQYSGRR